MHDTYILSRLSDNLFLGFGFFILFTSIFQLFVREELKQRISNAQQYAFDVIKYLGIILLCYSLFNWIYVYLINDNNFLTERATGPYKWAYYTMSFRSIIIALLTQLFWRRKFIETKWKTIMLSIIIVTLAICSGYNFERFVIIVTSLHRDYLPTSWENINYERNVFTNEALLITLVILWYFLKSTLIFTGILLVYWFFKNRRNDRIHTTQQ